MTLTAARPARASRRSPEASRANQPLWIAIDWMEAHCMVPDGFRKGQPLRFYNFQGDFFVHHYLVRGDAEWHPDNPVLGPAFVYSRSLLVGPQGLGKNPTIACQCCLEGVGPALWGGFAGKDEGYACADHGCRCGWEYPYDVGEPKGMLWPTPLVQITAFSQDSTDNTWDALRPMIELGPLSDVIPKTGEEFIRLPNDGRIDTVTSSDKSRLGQRITFAPQDELGLWTKANSMDKLADTQYRNLSKMGGRASLTTNAWDPGEHSIAQREYESSEPGVWKQYTEPPANLSYADKRERHKMHLAVYPPDVRRENGGHVDLDSIEAEAAKVFAHDPSQAARFYGNKLVSGGGKAFDSIAWNKLADARVVASKALVTLGFDGSRSGDWSALVATEIVTGYQWPLGIWDPGKYPGHEIPRSLVDEAVDLAFATFDVWRFYADPPYWKDELAAWQGRYGEKVVIPWETYRPRQISWAVRNFGEAIAKGLIKHDGDTTFATHIGNAYRRPTNVRDDKGEPMWTISKETPDSGLKIDTAMAAILSWEARTDAVASGVSQPSPNLAYFSGVADDPKPEHSFFGDDDE
jgi:hypothetical protein